MAKRSKRLQVVLELADKRKKEADRFLAEHLQRVERDKQQLVQLQEYQQQYEDEFRTALSAGANIQTVQNYQAFLAKIAATITQHKQAMATNQEQLARVKHYWQQVYGKQSALSTLVDKARVAEQQAEEKALQKQLDERSLQNKKSLL